MPGSALKLESFQFLHDVKLPLCAELDRRQISFRHLLELGVDSLLLLTRPTGENIDLYAGEVLLGTGEILVVDGTLAVRVADLREKPAWSPADEEDFTAEGDDAAAGQAEAA